MLEYTRLSCPKRQKRFEMFMSITVYFAAADWLDAGKTYNDSPQTTKWHSESCSANHISFFAVPN